MDDSYSFALTVKKEWLSVCLRPVGGTGLRNVDIFYRTSDKTQPNLIHGSPFLGLAYKPLRRAIEKRETSDNQNTPLDMCLPDSRQGISLMVYIYFRELIDFSDCVLTA